jgi:Uma2 family endonuclease
MILKRSCSLRDANQKGLAVIAKLKLIPEEQRLRLSLIPWKGYVAFCDAIGERHLRVTYDRGEMEVMSLSSEHEKEKKTLGRFMDVLSEEMEIEISSFGSMTCRNEGMQRALEPDECYWIRHEARVRGRKHIDLDSDPPPDLSVEIEISRSTLDRMSIYAALKVPEIWRWDGVTLTIHLLTSRGTYRVSTRSKAFPFLPMEEFVEFLKRTDLSEMKLIREFRAWVRANKNKWKK